MNSFPDQFGKFIGGLFFALVAMCTAACFLGYPVMWLWNYTMPSMFGFTEIDFFHALCLNLLCGILFGKGGSYSKSKKKNDSNGKD